MPSPSPSATSIASNSSNVPTQKAQQREDSGQHQQKEMASSPSDSAVAGEAMVVQEDAEREQQKDQEQHPPQEQKQPQQQIVHQAASSRSVQVEQLNRLLFGDNPVPQDVERWHTQGFNFSSNPEIPYGLVQLYGGPCGILAPVQAFVVKELLFGESPSGVSINSSSGSIGACPALSSVNDEKRTRALVTALKLISFRAASRSDDSKCSESSSRGPIAVVSGTDISNLLLHSFSDAEGAAKFYASDEGLNCIRSQIGVLCFVYSVILTRGVEAVKEEMDDAESPLVGRFGHCSQELVNLMLTGKAVTNVFDGAKVLGGGYKLQGIDETSEVGFLTLLEYLRYSKVGDNYKCPHFPVWVIGSESHYTVLFGVDKRIGRMTSKAKKLKAAKTAFLELDPEENGFIRVEQIGALAEKLSLTHIPLERLRDLADPDGIGLCLWNKVVSLVENNDTINAEPTPVMRSLQVQWNCAVCTYLNPANVQQCDMCGGSKPPPPKIQVVAPQPQQVEDEEVKVCQLFHFNGIDGHGQQEAQCTAVNVTVLDSDFQSPPSHDGKHGLKEVICTRWPSAVVDFPAGQEPKI